MALVSPRGYSVRVSIRILYVAEIVGKAGVFTVKKLLAAARRDLKADFVVGNADSATGGAGLGRQHAVYLRKLGVEAITTGECCYYKRDIVEHMPKAPYLIRPANYPYGNPGRGYKVFSCAAAGATAKIAVVQLLGQAGFSRVHLANPYQAITDLARKLREETPIIIPRLPRGDDCREADHVAPRVGPRVGGDRLAHEGADGRRPRNAGHGLYHGRRQDGKPSLGGRPRDPATRIGEYLSGIPVWAKDGTAGLELQGCLVEVGDDGHAISIKALRIPCDEVLEEKKAEGKPTDAEAEALPAEDAQD